MSGELPRIRDNVRAYLLDMNYPVLSLLQSIPKNDKGMLLVDPRSVVESSGAVLRMSDFGNQMQYSAADLTIRCLAGFTAYSVAGMYMEFVNAAHIPVPADPVFGRDAGISYYLGLGDHRDFLRVPLTVSPYFQSTNASRYVSNQVTFYAMSSGHTQGYNGKPFDATNQSTVIGLALVAMPDPANQSNDIILCRSYEMTNIEVDANRAVGLAHTIYSEA